MSWTQFLEWQAFADVEPFGPERDDQRFGSISTTIANVFRGKGQRPYKLKDLTPLFGDSQATKEEPNWKRMKQMGKMVVAMWKGLTK
jgi:hypothetical protein